MRLSLTTTQSVDDARTWQSNAEARRAVAVTRQWVLACRAITTLGYSSDASVKEIRFGQDSFELTSGPSTADLPGILAMLFVVKHCMIYIYIYT